ncbi:MAG: tRNA dihydrouridine(20/20a) synthase DusA [Gammaproteobacteria bacterium]|nr:tRNA dihydrouridine(20/20a) synthase DusA [Gammaproteobacteria bacterium]
MILKEQTAGSASMHRFCVAPMLDWTDRHERYFLRLISHKAMLYTEMVTVGALIHGDVERHLRFNHEEHPLALQLGGSDPEQLAKCSVMAEQFGYDEINLNVGCPSSRVQSGQFGACLMAKSALVAECIRAMRASVSIPVSVKCRIGIDDQDSDAFLQDFIHEVAAAGCRTFIIHARIALLQGLSPKENREIPPLNYPRVISIKEVNPDLCVVLNGGVRSIDECKSLLKKVDGVMMGREAYQNPWILADVDNELYGISSASRTRHEVMRSYFPYVETQLREGTPLQHMTRHILGLFHGQPGGKAFRRHLSTNAFRKEATISVLQDALDLVPEYSEFGFLSQNAAG